MKVLGDIALASPDQRRDLAVAQLGDEAQADHIALALGKVGETSAEERKALACHCRALRRGGGWEGRLRDRSELDGFRAPVVVDHQAPRRHEEPGWCGVRITWVAELG